MVVNDTTSETLSRFIMDRLPNRESANHSKLDYVRGPVHTNGVESFWSMLKWAHMGIFHKISSDHLHRYVNEFSGRHNMRELGTLAQMSLVADRAIGQRLRYKDLVG